MLGIWRMMEKPRILPNVEERENETYFDDNLKLCKIMSFGNMVLRNDMKQSLSRRKII